MTASQLAGKKLTTDRIVSIVFLCLGVLFEVIWFVPSLLSVMISDSGLTPIRTLGIQLMIFGPIGALIALAVTTIVLLSLKRRSMVFGIAAFAGPILVVVIGALLALTTLPAE